MSKINIAQGIKREAILEGEGQAAKIMQEARSLCEALENISAAINSGDALDSSALKLRLSEQYVEALSEILRKSNVVMIPKGDSSSDNVFSAQNVA